MSTKKEKKYLESPIIFLGFGRSGTSIISEAVFQHSDLAWVANYQALFPFTNKINLLRNLFDNQFWKIRGQKKEINDVPTFNKIIFRPGEVYSFWKDLTGRDFGKDFLLNIDETKKNRERIRSFFAGIVKYQKRTRLCFKVTGPSRLQYLRSIFPDAKFVWIHRKPLPNIRSLLNVYFYQERKNKLWWSGNGVYSKRELEKVKEWNEPALIAALQYHKVHQIYNFERSKLNLNSSIIEVSYEAFTANPEEQIKRIVDFLDLDYTYDINEFFKKNRIVNRNTKEEFYISQNLDRKVLDISNTGIGLF